MKHRNSSLSVALAFVVLTLVPTACGGAGDKSLPHYGAFMVDGSDLVELTEMTAYGVPSSSELEGVPVAPNSQPVIVLWQPDTRLQYLQFFSTSSGPELRYIADPKDEGIIELRPADALDPGRYCYIQGDPLGLGLPAWCFEVEGDGMAAPRSSASPKASIRWVPLVAAGLLLIVTAVVVLILGLTGRLKEWSSAGFSAGKWRVQAMMLGNDRTRMERDKVRLLSELGTKAWEARVAHPDYAELSAQLEVLGQQRTALREQMQAAEQQLQQARKSHSQADSEYAARINRAQEELKGATTRLNQVRTEGAALAKRLSKAQADQQKTQAEVQTLRDRLDKAQASGAPDQETQITSLSNAITALEQSLVGLGGEVPHLQSEIVRLGGKQQPLAGEVSNLEQQLAQVQVEQREALAPLDRLIADLQGEIRGNTERVTALSRQMTPLTDDLGPLVDRARPESPVLSELYARLDRFYHDMANLSQRHDLLQVRLAAVDTGAVRGFYVALAGLAVVLILAVVLLVIALA